MESPHQVDMKNVVKCWKDFLWYFATLKTYREKCFSYCEKYDKVAKGGFFRSGPQLPRDDQKFVFLILLPNIDFNLNARQDNNNNNTGLNMRPPVAECSLKG